MNENDQEFDRIEVGNPHLNNLSKTQHDKLFRSKHFCIIPWIHLNVHPDGKVYPCCLGDEQYPTGNLKNNSLEEIWNGKPLKDMRRNMLLDKPCQECTKCYEQESFDIQSLRINSNKLFGQHIVDINKTRANGEHPEMKIRYWDIRFSNVCNLKCRTCSSMFSSRWYDDEVKLLGETQVKTPRIQFPGKTKDDLWNQVKNQIPDLEQIYFAGGEPLLMEEHLRILKELIRTNNTQVKIFYNTNLTDLQYKKENLLELWNHFPNICIAASLDELGGRAEIIRSGTIWENVEQNIRDIKKYCPHIDFMANPTLSILNIWNFTKFHRYMVEQNFISPSDFSVNILLNPLEYRIDILPLDIKERFITEFREHLRWLEPLDPLKRSASGFTSAIKFLMSKNSHKLLTDFWGSTSDLDWVRNESIVDHIPELKELLQYKSKYTRV